jgi:capsular polysaccharide biosynthesis protein
MPATEPDLNEPFSLTRVLRTRWSLFLGTAIAVTVIAVLISLVRTELERRQRDLSATATATFTDPKLLEERIAGVGRPVGSPASIAFRVSTFLRPGDVDKAVAALKEKLNSSSSVDSIRSRLTVHPTSTVGTLAFTARGSDAGDIAGLANGLTEMVVVHRQQAVERQIQTALAAATSSSERRRLRRLQRTEPAVAAQIARKAVAPSTNSIKPSAGASALYGLVASILLGLALTVLIAARDRTVRLVPTVARATRAPVVATDSAPGGRFGCAWGPIDANATRNAAGRDFGNDSLSCAFLGVRGVRRARPVRECVAARIGGDERAARVRGPRLGAQAQPLVLGAATSTHEPRRLRQLTRLARVLAREPPWREAPGTPQAPIPACLEGWTECPRVDSNHRHQV